MTWKTGCVVTVGPASTFCLLRYWYDIYGSCPKHIIYCDIDGLYSISNEWQYVFGSSYEVQKLTRRAKKKGGVYNSAQEEARKLRESMRLLKVADDENRMIEFNTLWGEKPRSDPLKGAKSQDIVQFQITK